MSGSNVSDCTTSAQVPSTKTSGSSTTAFRWFAATAGVGTILNTAVVAYGVQELLVYSPSDSSEKYKQASIAYQQGKLEKAISLVSAIHPSSDNYQQATAAANQWPKEWQLAKTQFQKLKKAFAAGKWQQVREISHQLPPIEFWQKKAEPFRQQAQLHLESQAYQQLQAAYSLAVKKNFAGAIRHLQQVPSQTKLDAKVATKLKEYRHKQKIKKETQAHRLLQSAYNLAVSKDFTGAIAQLQKIPKNTQTYQRVSAKLQEYRQKQQARCQWYLTRAEKRARRQDFIAALYYLQQIPPSTSAYRLAEQHASEYCQQLPLHFSTSCEPSHWAGSFLPNPATSMQAVDIPQFSR